MKLLANNAKSTLNGAITNSATSLAVQSGDGAKFPNPSGGDYFYATLANAANPETAWEIIKVTARSTDTFSTIVRGQLGTSAVAWNNGDRIELRIVTQEMLDLIGLETGLVTEPAAGPIATDLQLFAAKRSRRELFIRGAESQQAPALQRALGDVSFTMLIPQPGGTGVSVVGDIETSTGTKSGYTPTSTDYVSSQPAVVLTSAGTTNTGNSWRGQTSGGFRFWVGNASGLGGFYFKARVTITALTSAQRAFIGLTTLSTDPNAADPSGTAADMIGVGADVADANFQIISKDGTTAAKTDLGIKKDITNNPNQMLEVEIFCAPNDSTIYVTVDQWIGNTKTRVCTNQAITSHLPRSNQFMRYIVGVGTGSSDATAVAFRLHRVYMETLS